MIWGVALGCALAIGIILAVLSAVWLDQADREQRRNPGDNRP